MTTVSAEVVLASRSPEGITLWTMALTYPRFIHPEFLTHRKFSRNASSSRAIPIMKSILAVLKNSAAPVEWGSNKSGMQAGAELTGWRKAVTKAAWHGAKYAAVGAAWVMAKAGAHKQIANRVLEPWSHITVLVSATDWANWDALRRHPDADPTIQRLAEAIFEAQQAYRLAGKIQDLKPGEWHLPYVTEADREAAAVLRPRDPISLLKEISSARCARVSYLTHDNMVPSVDKDRNLFIRLAHHDPMHASPLEHQATPDQRVKVNESPDGKVRWGDVKWLAPHDHGNFTGWRQFRKTLPNEAVREFHERIAA